MSTASQFVAPETIDDNRKTVPYSQTGKPSTNSGLPYYMNILFPPWFFSTIISVWYWGFSTVFPYVYGDPTVILGHRIFSTFVLIEMMVNWLCICSVDSTFGRPPGMRDGRRRGGQPGAVEGAAIHSTEPLPPNMISRNCTDTQPLDVNSAFATKYYRPVDGSVIVSMPNSSSSLFEDLPLRTTNLYFSWKPCLICEHMRPPRCHHCASCGKCVLKRDHHCYFAGTCVGLKNQRHFIVLTFWASIATVYAFSHSLPYIYYDFLDQTSYVDLLLPMTVIRFILGYSRGEFVLLMTMEWSLVCLVYFSIMFFVEQMILVWRSLTTFENENKMNLHDIRDCNGRLTAVFGKNWLLHFLVPLHTMYDPVEDAINWPTITSR